MSWLKRLNVSYACPIRRRRLSVSHVAWPARLLCMVLTALLFSAKMAYGSDYQIEVIVFKRTDEPTPTHLEEPTSSSTRHWPENMISIAPERGQSRVPFLWSQAVLLDADPLSSIKETEQEGNPVSSNPVFLLASESRADLFKRRIAQINPPTEAAGDHPDKVQEQLPGSVWEHYQRSRRILHVSGTPAKSYEEQQGILKTLNRSILQHRVVAIEYQSLGKPASRREIEPYAVLFYQSSLYIIAAEASNSTTLRHWKLDRFLSAEALDRWFQPDDTFDLSEYVGKSLGIFSQQEGLEEFQIRISAYAAPWVLEDPWHADQTVERLDDGAVLLTVKATHELEVIPRVLALGGEAELISPVVTRKRLAEIASKLKAIYDSCD